ncbi:hypothetical protein [Synechococcus sp. BS55D]|uniref:hypothetical protein n=1 Tax=Synechococcus sp. BS55D TaxID=2055943 RepID=UPI00103FD4EC|nr:hypothetical protein [Synechococcus sp. BS55D]TCD58096.1 hypothetical protein CWE16_02000 [Synechococcus sp. BS55D]
MPGWPIREDADQGRRRHQRMQAPVWLFQYGAFQPLWQQPGLLQVGPRLTDSPASLQVNGLGVEHLNVALARAAPVAGATSFGVWRSAPWRVAPGCACGLPQGGAP